MKPTTATPSKGMQFLVRSVNFQTWRGRVGVWLVIWCWLLVPYLISNAGAYSVYHNPVFKVTPDEFKIRLLTGGVTALVLFPMVWCACLLLNALAALAKKKP